MLNFRVPEETILIGFAEDLAVVAEVKHPENMELYMWKGNHQIMVTNDRLLDTWV